MTRHKPITIQYPAIYDGLPPFELAGWHQHHRESKELDKCLVIENVVNKLPIEEKKIIKQLKYYIPVKRS